MRGPVNIIVTAAVLANSSEIFGVLDPDAGGAATFSVALSPNGQANATHYGCSTYLEERTYNALKNMGVSEFKAFCDVVAGERNRTRVNNVTAFKNGAALDEGWFWDFVTAQGLQPVAVDMQQQTVKPNGR